MKQAKADHDAQLRKVQERSKLAATNDEILAELLGALKDGRVWPDSVLT